MRAISREDAGRYYCISPRLITSAVGHFRRAMGRAASACARPPHSRHGRRDLSPRLRHYFLFSDMPGRLLMPLGLFFYYDTHWSRDNAADCCNVISLEALSPYGILCLILRYSGSHEDASRRVISCVACHSSFTERSAVLTYTHWPPSIFAGRRRAPIYYHCTADDYFKI